MSSVATALTGDPPLTQELPRVGDLRAGPLLLLHGLRPAVRLPRDRGPGPRHGSV